MNTSIDNLSEDTLAHIFGYIDDPSTLLACERQCTAFRRVLADDALWISCPGSMDGPGSSCRENAFIHRVIKNIEKSQRQEGCCSNPILTTLGVEGTISFFSDFHAYPFVFFLRGDTLALMVELVVDFLTTMLCQANEIAIHVSEEMMSQAGIRVYPQVNEKNLKFLDQLSSVSGGGFRDGVFNLWQRGPHIRQHYFHNYSYTSRMRNMRDFTTLIPATTQTALVRALADRAAVVKLESGAFDYIWGIFVNTVEALLDQCCELVKSFVENAPVAAPGDDIDLYNDTPPLVRDDENPSEQKLVIVPGILQEAATTLGMKKCYLGSDWITRDGQTEKHERAEARAMYFRSSKTSVDEEEEWDVGIEDDSSDDEVSWNEDDEEDEEQEQEEEAEEQEQEQEQEKEQEEASSRCFFLLFYWVLRQFSE